MASKTTTYVVPVENTDGFDARATDSMAYTHAVVGPWEGAEAAFSWHTSAQLAAKALQALGADAKGCRIVPASAYNGAKAKVVKQLRRQAELGLVITAEEITPSEVEEAPAEEAPKKERKARERKGPATAVHVKDAEPTLAEDPRETPGYRTHTKSRSTKTVAVLVDAQEQSFETPGRWNTICVDHKFVVAQPGQREARDVLSHPETWCAPCGKAFRKAEKAATA